MSRKLGTMFAIATVAGGIGACSRSSAPTPEGASQEEKPAVRKEFGGGPVKLSVQLSADSLTTADVLDCQLTLRMDQGFEAEFPDLAFPADVPGMILTRFDQHEKKEKATTLQFRDYELEPEFPGTFELPALEVYYHGANQVKEESFETEPISWTVTETPATADMLELKPFRELVTVAQIQAAHKRTWPWVVGGIGSVAVLAAFFVFLVRRPRAAPPPRPAHEIAMEALRALAAEDLVAKGQIEPFFVRVTSIIRDYIETAFGLRAPEQTTEEFLAQMAATPAVARHRQVLEPFLTAADEVKFARAKPETSVIQRTFDTARDFILQTSGTERESA